MTKPELIETLNGIFIKLFKDDSIQISEKTTAADIEGWDSLKNIQLIVRIEKELKIKFRTEEIQDWKNVGDMCDSILRKF